MCGWMMRVMVLKMMMITMMILMMPGAMMVMVAMISPSRGNSPAESPRQEGVSSLSRFRREEAAENFYEVDPR